MLGSEITGALEAKMVFKALLESAYG